MLLSIQISFNKCRLALFLLVFGLLSSCGGRNADSANPIDDTPTEVQHTLPSTPVLDERSGDELAKVYCTGCHQLPTPDLLDRHTWKTFILPRMGHYYGIYETKDTRDSIIEGGRAGMFVERANLFPQSPTLDTSLYSRIAEHFIYNAPTALPQPPRPPLKIGLKHFDVRTPSYRASVPMISMVKIAGVNKLYISDAGKSSLLIADRNFVISRNAPAREGVSWIYEKDGESLALVMGTFNPTDMNIGYLMTLPQERGGDARILVQDLQRPVHFDMADIDGDGAKEIVICEYGRHTGSLSLWKMDNAGIYRKRILRSAPGATKAYMVDLNRDGRLDIVALFGQGDEAIFAYYNQGNGEFVEDRLLSFPATYGSSFFDLVDFNGDGHLDIIHTAGDNADYDPILKGYHGIRIFENDGNNRYKETLFYPLNGAYKAIVHDFDGDGDLDIAAISFFPDYANRPEESFVFLEQTGDRVFEASSFPGSSDGRWIAMDIGDIDGDGDMDLVLGSMVFGTDFSEYFDRWLKNGIPYLILENKTK